MNLENKRLATYGHAKNQEELVQSLVKFCKQRQAAGQDEPFDAFLTRFDARVRNQRYGLSPPEISEVMRQVREQLQLSELIRQK